MEDLKVINLGDEYRIVILDDKNYKLERWQNTRRRVKKVDKNGKEYTEKVDEMSWQNKGYHGTLKSLIFSMMEEKVKSTEGEVTVQDLIDTIDRFSKQILESLEVKVNECK